MKKMPLCSIPYDFRSKMKQNIIFYRFICYIDGLTARDLFFYDIVTFIDVKTRIHQERKKCERKKGLQKYKKKKKKKQYSTDILFKYSRMKFYYVLSIHDFYL